MTASSTTTTTSGQFVRDMTAVDGQTAWLLKYNLVSGTISLMQTTNGPSGFVQIANLLPAFAKIHFFSTTVGIGVVAPTGATSTWPIYRTTDGGVTWYLITSASATTSSTNEWVATKQSIGNCLWLTTYNGALLRTPDAGLTWTVATSPGKVAFEDALTGLSYRQVTNGQELFRTSNGGATWAPVAFSGQPLFGTVTAVPGLPGTYYSGGYVPYSPGINSGGVSAISRDGGTSWQVLSSDNIAFSQITAGGSNEIWAATDRNIFSPQVPLVRYSPSALAAKNAMDASAVVAYPNPTSGFLHLEGLLKGAETVRVYDALGRLCQSTEVSERVRTVDLSAQPAGTYQLQLRAADGMVRNLRVSKTQ